MILKVSKTLLALLANLTKFVLLPVQRSAPLILSWFMKGNAQNHLDFGLSSTILLLFLDSTVYCLLK